VLRCSVVIARSGTSNSHFKNLREAGENGRSQAADAFGLLRLRLKFENSVAVSVAHHRQLFSSKIKNHGLVERLHILSSFRHAVENAIDAHALLHLHTTRVTS
jgi:hypothetical protein